MKKSKITRKILIYTYIFLVLVAIGLNYETDFSDLGNICVTVSMFLIVGIVLLYSYKKLGIIMRITEELKSAVESINQQFEVQKTYLWEHYQSSQDLGLFKEGYLIKHYKNYCDEVKRLEEETNIGYKCDIEDYINQELIEYYLKKNLLNIVPGAMTGLGILGTFVGLSVGLQNFTTGTADEILLGITTLMDGIKIAFHTSIFGMVFSLVFNLTYKNILEDCLEQLDMFLDEFRRKVSPDSKNERERLILNVANKQSDTIIKAEEKLEVELANCVKILANYMSELIKSQNKQNVLLEELPSNIVKGVSESITDAFLPQFEKMDKTLSDFSFSITEKQNAALNDMVDKFIGELNSAVENNFVNLSNILDDTCHMQEKSNQHMQEVMQKTGEMLADAQEINIVSGKIMEEFQSYINLIERLQEVINENFMNVNIQLDANNQMSTKLMGYVENLVEYECRITETANNFEQDVSEQVHMLEKVGDEIADFSQESLKILAERAEEYNETLASAVMKQISGIELISQQVLEKYNDSLTMLSKDVVKNNAVIADSIKQQMVYIQAVSENANRNNLELVNVAKKQIKDVIYEFNRASSELAGTAERLDGNLEESLQAVLKQFDKELSSIAENLSGTITRIENTTNQVPHVIASAYDSMYKVFSDFNQEIENMKVEIQKK